MKRNVMLLVLLALALGCKKTETGNNAVLELESYTRTTDSLWGALRVEYKRLRMVCNDFHSNPSTVLHAPSKECLAPDVSYTMWRSMDATVCVGLDTDGHLLAQKWPFMKESAFDEISLQYVRTNYDGKIQAFWAATAWSSGSDVLGMLYSRWEHGWPCFREDIHSSTFGVDVPVQAAWRQPDGGIFVLGTDRQLYWTYRSWETSDGKLELVKIPDISGGYKARTDMPVPVLEAGEHDIVVPLSYAPTRRIMIYYITLPDAAFKYWVDRFMIVSKENDEITPFFERASLSFTVSIMTGHGACTVTVSPETVPSEAN